MNYNEKVFNEQIHAVQDFLFHYTSYRILHQNFDSLCKKGSIDFWVYTINSHYLQAINLWCMVFGAKSNEIHWKKLNLNQELKSLILSELNLNEKDYSFYWSEITDWRNQFAAHRVPDFRSATPDLKMARSIVFVYEKWLHKYTGDVFNFTLENYETEYCSEVEKTVNDILK